MIKVIVKNLDLELVAQAYFPTQELAESWVAEQTASQQSCLWGKLAYTESVEVGTNEETGDPIYEVVHHEQDFTVEYIDATAEVQKAHIQAVVADAIAFGAQLMVEFASENVAMGITQSGKTKEVRRAMSEALNALQTGSLYDAIDEIRAIPPESKDEVFVSDARLLEFLNKIEEKLGLELSVEL